MSSGGFPCTYKPLLTLCKYAYIFLCLWCSHSSGPCGLIILLGPQLLPLSGLICPYLGIPQMKAVILYLSQYHHAANGLPVLGYLPQI